MTSRIFLLFSLWLLLPLQGLAQEVSVTRNFTGLWFQHEQENQGISLQIIDRDGAQKEGVAFWFTYGEDMKSAWFMGQGPVSGNRIDMVLYELEGIAFFEDNNPDKDQVEIIGTMVFEFSSCDDGNVTYTTEIERVGTGVFPIKRLTDLYNTTCTGGVSDDTQSDVVATEQRISLVPARAGINASGHADFEERADRTEFSVEVEDLPDGSYRIWVGDVDRGELIVSLAMGETEFRSPVEAGKILLTFDPRGQVIEVHDGQGAVLTSADAVFEPGDDNGDDDGGEIDFGTTEIEVELSNSGVYPAASGDARLRPQPDRTDFSVEIEDVPVGSYDLRVGTDIVGTIQVVMQQDGAVQGKIEFRNPVEPGKILLDFDPRNQQIDVLDGSTVILETLFPGN